MKPENVKPPLPEEAIEKFKLAKAVQDAMFDGVAGKLINFDSMPSENLFLLAKYANDVLSWRAAPNDNRGGH